MNNEHDTVLNLRSNSSGKLEINCLGGAPHLHFHYGDAEQTAMLRQILANQAESKQREETMVNRTAEFQTALGEYIAAVLAWKKMVDEREEAHKAADAAFEARIKELTDADELEDATVGAAIETMKTEKAKFPAPEAPVIPPVIDPGTGTDTGTGTGTGTGTATEAP